MTLAEVAEKAYHCERIKGKTLQRLYRRKHPGQTISEIIDTLLDIVEQAETTSEAEGASSQ